MVGLLALLAACVDAPIDAERPCDRYAPSPDVFAVCISRRVRSEPTTAAAARWCDQLTGDAATVCRSSWMAAAATQETRFQGTREELLTFCAGAPDCAFFVLDQRPEGTFPEQAEACAKWTGKMAPDCIGHASQRFFDAKPDDAALKSVAESSYGERAIPSIAHYLACAHRTTCPDLGAWTEACQAALPTATVGEGKRCN